MRGLIFARRDVSGTAYLPVQDALQFAVGHNEPFTVTKRDTDTLVITRGNHMDTPPPDDLREQVARLVDPEAFKKYYNPTIFSGDYEKRCADARVRADQIIALLGHNE